LGKLRGDKRPQRTLQDGKRDRGEPTGGKKNSNQIQRQRNIKEIEHGQKEILVKPLGKTEKNWQVERKLGKPRVMGTGGDGEKNTSLE